MIERLLLITCAAYLVAASPAYAQRDHDGCGGDACATDNPYDLGYHDGYEGDSFTSSSELKIDPVYQAGFSEGEMDSMDEKDARTAEKQAREDRLDRQPEDMPTAARRAPLDQAPDRQSQRALDAQADRGLVRQANSTLDDLLSGGSDMAAMDEEDALTAQEQAGGWRLMNRRRDRTDPDAGLFTTEKSNADR
jgi:hypothetical protein